MKATAEFHFSVGYVEIFLLEQNDLGNASKIAPSCVCIYMLSIWIGNSNDSTVWRVKLPSTHLEKYFMQNLQHLSLWTLSTHCSALCLCVTLMVKLSSVACTSNSSPTGALQWRWPLAFIREGPLYQSESYWWWHTPKDSRKKSYYFSWDMHLCTGIEDKQRTIAFLGTRRLWYQSSW